MMHTAKRDCKGFGRVSIEVILNALDGMGVCLTEGHAVVKGMHCSIAAGGKSRGSAAECCTHASKLAKAPSAHCADCRLSDQSENVLRQN
jgi:hypothetical protein